ncbi:MAG: phage terminase large subunit [Patescibacteria group bacterium]|nr:phage terminase large subunit [Patescibacteria group bacterium]
MTMLKLSQKQARAVQAVNDPKVDTLVLFGTVGTGKTDVAAHIVISICFQFPKTYLPVFRQNISTALKSVIPSYLEMLDKMELVAGRDYTYNQTLHIITFYNKSQIIFVEADQTKDREGKKIKGINATGNHIDEADELQYEMFIQATSRRGRRNESGQPSISIITMNPNDSWAKELYYDPWKAGTLPQNIAAIEFDLSDSWQTQQDIDALKTNPEWWTQRYLYNNWEYSDESTSLFKSRAWAASIVESLDGADTRYAGYDVARSGTDRSVRALLYGSTIADLTIVKDKTEQKDTAEQADWLIVDAGVSGYGIEKLAVDAVGLGVGVVDGLAKSGYRCKEYMSGAKPDPHIRLEDNDKIPINFDNLRSQMIYLYARGIELGIIKHFAGCPFLKDLQKEAMVHNFDITDKVLKVESKDKIKVRLGSSPDILDAVIMGLYVALRKAVGFRVRVAG